MDITERIKNLGEYFLGFSVQECVTLLVNFPDKWTLFGITPICEEFNVAIEKNANGNGYYFLCRIDDGFEPVFDAADFIIEHNKALEAKANLLKAKAEELKKLFEDHELEELERLRFVIDTPGQMNGVVEQSFDLEPHITLKDIKKHKERKTSKKATADTKKSVEVVTEKKKEEEPFRGIDGADFDAYEKEQSKKKAEQQKHVDGDSGLMDFVKEELNNE